MADVAGSSRERRLIIVAGPNGAGKSTLTQGLVPGFLLIDPDAIAREEGLSPVAAGRATLSRMRSCIRDGRSLVVETTLSGKGLFSIMEAAQQSGFQLRLHFVGLDNAELAMARVRQRVVLGGHDILENDLRRRFERSFRNLPRAIRFCEVSYLYDNSGESHLLLAIFRKGQMEFLNKSIPHPPWLSTLLKELG